MKKDYIQNIEGGERRFLPHLPELRASEDNSRKFGGLGIVYNKLSENFLPSFEGGLYEIVEPGAARGLLDDEDIMLLFNHDNNYVLGRNGVTASLNETDEGVEYNGTAPNTSVGNDLLENLKLKNIRKSSFAFVVKEEREEKVKYGDMGLINLRRIISFKRLYDFSPVTYPAYPDTTVAQRNLRSMVEAEEREAKDYLVKMMKRKHEFFQLTN